MTDLTQALAELRQMELTYGQLWTAREVMQTQNADNCKSIATVLNAALSGTMIPRADADLAMALMVEKAGKAIRSEAQISPYHNGMTAVYQRGLSDGFEAAAQVVDALVPASALADLKALRDERDRLDAVTNTLSEMWEGEQTARHSAEAELVTLRAQVERLTGALTIAANRLHRCSVDYDTGTREFIEVGEWADEASAALTEGAAP